MFFSDDMKELVRLFQKHDVHFAVCGGFAVAHYGFVRATMDFDLLVLPDENNAVKIMAALKDFGFGNAPIEKTAFLRLGSAITLGVQPNQIDLLTSMSSRPTADIISNAETTSIKDITLKVVSLEDLLFAKKESDRPKDRIDIEELERAQQMNRE
ncbi:MAG: nucleotidyltransferase [Myxococcota bacterium]|nr:nucleotidyltransferase [Myxococcota bacterium]